MQTSEAINPRAAGTGDQEEVGDRGDKERKEGYEDEYRIVCGKCKRGDCGKCEVCVCCKEGREEEGDRGVSSR